jgi:diguanylate cyclase (GGDEF)-like protein/PAS domain S-box-containing protein
MSRDWSGERMTEGIGRMGLDQNEGVGNRVPFLANLAMLLVLSTASAILGLLFFWGVMTGILGKDVIQDSQILPWLLVSLIAALFAVSCFLVLTRARITRDQHWVRMVSTSVEQSPAAMVITDPEGVIQYVNPRFEMMSGYSSEEVQGKKPRIFKSGKTGNEVYAELWQTVLDGRSWEGEFENMRKDGRSYFVSAKITPLLDGAGKIEKLLAIQEDVTEKKRLLEDLKRLAQHDGLTGCLNRNHFMHSLSAECARARRYQQPFSVLLFDLDHFKQVNDHHGHHAGDLVLREFVKEVNANLRENDLLGRLGGEEFGARLAQTKRADALLLAERLRLATEKLEVLVDETTIRFTVSIGVAEWQESDSDAEDLLKRSDRALYDAKQSGRNRVAAG